MKRDHRIPLHINSYELHQINEFRWQNRIPSQQEAVRQLIAKGLDSAAPSIKRQA